MPVLTSHSPLLVWEKTSAPGVEAREVLLALPLAHRRRQGQGQEQGVMAAVVAVQVVVVVVVEVTAPS